MAIMKGVITEVKQAEMEVSKEEIARCASAYLSSKELILMARDTWLYRIGLPSGREEDVDLQSQDLSNGMRVHTWIVWNKYRNEWCAWSRTVTVDDVITWEAFQKALRAVEVN